MDGERAAAGHKGGVRMGVGQRRWRRRAGIAEQSHTAGVRRVAWPDANRRKSQRAACAVGCRGYSGRRVVAEVPRVAAGRSSDNARLTASYPPATRAQQQCAAIGDAEQAIVERTTTRVVSSDASSSGLRLVCSPYEGSSLSRCASTGGGEGGLLWGWMGVG